jgi:hypothetical protein
MKRKTFKFEVPGEVFTEIDIAKAERDMTSKELLLNLMLESDELERIDKSVLEDYLQ